MSKEREAFDAWFKSLNENGRTTYFLGQESTVAWEAWQAAKAQAVPDGFVVVPKEPTEKMLDAARRRQWDDLSSPLEDMDVLKYKAMLEAQEPTND